MIKMKNKKENKKAQTNFFDFIIGFTIFIVVLIIFFNASQKTNYYEENKNFLSNTILSEGIPKNWNETNYYKPGILTNKSLDEKKYEMLYNLSKKNLLKKIYKKNFMIEIYNYNGTNKNNLEIKNISYISTNYNYSFNNISNYSKNIYTEERIINYNDTLYIIKFLIWN